MADSTDPPADPNASSVEVGDGALAAASSPPRPPRPSYAALAAAAGTSSSSADQSMRDPPPPRPPKPVVQNSRPVAASTFFEGPATTVTASGLRGPRPMSTSPTTVRTPGSYSQVLAAAKPAQPNDDQIPADDADGLSSDDDELRIAGNEGYSASPAVCPTTGRKAIRVYGSAAKRSYSSRAEAAPPAGPPPMQWDEDNWGDGSNGPPTQLVASTSAARYEGAGRRTEGQSGGATWEELVQAGYASQHPQQERRTSRHFSKSRTPPPPPPPPLVVASAPPVEVGGWTTPRVLATAGEYGSKPGIWHHTMYDFEIGDTPAGETATTKLRYSAMGTEIEAVGPESAPKPADDAATATAAAAAAEPASDSDMLILDDGSSQSVVAATVSEASADDPIEDPDKPTPAPPRRTVFRTVTRAELDAIRPHPSLFFCPHTFSWCFFARTADGEPVPNDEPVLWQARMAGAQEDDIGAWFTAAGIDPPPPDPIAPAKLAKRSLERLSLDDLNPAGLVELVSNRRRVCAFSTQDWYPAVIPASEFHALLDHRGSRPTAGQTALTARFQAVKTIWRTLDNLLFVGEQRGLPVTGRIFTKTLGWDSLSESILIDTLGATVLQQNGQDTVTFKNLSDETEGGRKNRTRLLRCWLELAIWLEHAKRVHGMKADDFGINTRVSITNARSRIAELMGHGDLPRVPAGRSWEAPGVARLHLPDVEAELHPLAIEYSDLGVMPNVADEVIIKVYDVKCSEEPYLLPFRLHALCRIAESRATDALRLKVAQERSLGRHPANEIAAAFGELRLPDPFNSSTYTSEEALVEALQKRIAEVEHPGRRTVLLQAARMVADHTGSEYFRAVLESSAGELGETPAKPQMDLEAACRALGIEKDTDDEFVIMTYDIRLIDAESESDKVKVKDALRVVAEARNSPALQRVLQTNTGNSDAGWEASVAANPRIPVGLTNIANTCYLNSLLQYFFTVREMRETILTFEEHPHADGDDQSQIRVGGRLVSPAEIKRSKRFVILLKTLFEQLIHAPVSAVTPETELAYLALVPSREEVEAAAASPDASLLTNEPGAINSDSQTASRASPAASSDTVKSPSSVLGKRKNGEPDDQAMQLDLLSPVASKADRPLGERDLNRSLDAPSASKTFNGTSEEPDPEDADNYPRIKRGRSTDGDKAEVSLMQLDKAASPAPPPLPPRPTAPPQDKEKELERQVSTYMAFGRQNDVTECMDNVMFQVEAALLSNARNGHGEETANLLRKTFFGTLRQEIAFDEPAEVEDPVRSQDQAFSSLLVDVPASSATTVPGLTRDIYDALDTLFEPAQVELESRSARRHIRLIAPPPPVLQVQLQRVQYDRERQSVYKSNAHLAFEDELDVGRYLESQADDADLQAKHSRTDAAREELRRVRARLSELTQNTTSTSAALVRSALSHAKHLANSLLPPSTSDEDELMASSPEEAPQPSSVALRELLTEQLFEDTEQEVKDLEDEIASLAHRVVELKRGMRQTWDEGGLERKSRYKLTAVFIHRGTALSGHYYIYQRDPREETRWLKYNDSLVTEVDADEIFRETTGDTNAYFLSYVRMDCLDAIEPIKREPA